MQAPTLFKALSDPIRLRCIALLAQHEELCVCELIYALDLPQPKVSHHLAILRKAGVVSDRKAGLWNYYRINTDLPQWVMDVILTTTDGIQNQPPFSADSLALEQMPDRPGNQCCA